MRVVASADAITTNLAARGRPRTRKRHALVITATLWRPVPARERQCAAAAACGRCRGGPDPRSPFEFGSNPWMNVGPAGRPSPLVARRPPSGGAADDPPLATVETSDPTGSLTRAANELAFRTEATARESSGDRRTDHVRPRGRAPDAAAQGLPLDRYPPRQPPQGAPGHLQARDHPADREAVSLALGHCPVLLWQSARPAAAPLQRGAPRSAAAGGVRGSRRQLSQARAATVDPRRHAALRLLRRAEQDARPRPGLSDAGSNRDH